MCMSVHTCVIFIWCVCDRVCDRVCKNVCACVYVECFGVVFVCTYL